MEAASKPESDAMPLPHEKLALQEEQHKSNDSEGGHEEKSAESVPLTKSAKRRRKRKARKENAKNTEELSDEILEEFELENDKSKPKSAAERIFVKNNKSKEESSAGVDGNEVHANEEQGVETPGHHKHRRRRQRKKKTDVTDSSTPEKEQPSSHNTTPASKRSTPRNGGNSPKLTPLIAKRKAMKSIGQQRMYLLV